MKELAGKVAFVTGGGSLKAVIEVGLDPVVLARHVVTGIRSNAQYIIPYPEFRETLERLFNDVLGALADPASDPDMQKRVDAFARRQEERKQER